MNKHLFSILLILLLFACKEDPIDLPEDSIPSDAIEFLQFETQTTYQGSLSLYAAYEDRYNSFQSWLNEEELDIFSALTLDEAGYYDLKIDAVIESDTIDLNFQFVIVDTFRGEAEWGLNKFTPKEIEDQLFALSDLDFIYPRQYPKDLSLPLIFSANAPNENLGDYYGHLTIDNLNSTIKRGVGSVLLPPDRSNSELPITLYNEELIVDILDIEPDYIPLEGIIENNTILEKEGYYHIVSDLTISSSDTLLIEEGCIIKIDEGLNIYNNGQIIIQGSVDRPIVFACADPDSQWGGFISTGANTRIEVQHTIFTQSGFNDTPAYQYGHAKRQALFYQDNSTLVIHDSYAIDHIGQIFYLRNQSTLEVNNTLIQRAKTAGEIVGSELVVSGCTFTDFPEYSTQYLDEDNDCIYLIQSNAVITNSSFMWSKDDGIDSGGDGGGTVLIDNCHFEGIFHEAIAMSSAEPTIKNHEISNSTFVNNGQGIELGYSSPDHLVSVRDCHFEGNMIGVRYGDNYARPVTGYMELFNCTFEANLDKDIWNFVRSEWSGVEEGLSY